MVCPGDEADPRGPAQLLIFAVKATALEASVPMVRNQVGKGYRDSFRTQWNYQ